VEELERYAEWLDSKNLLLRSRPLFPANGGRSLTRQEYWLVMKKTAMLVGIHGKGISTHTMRKTFAERVHVHFMEMVVRGERVDVLRSTQETLGHKDPESTTHYLRENKKRVWEAVMAI
jgi:site-specific recombinase XerD